MRFAGGYPASCGERLWPLAYAEPARYNARLLQALWYELGGKLNGSVRDGLAPTTPPSFEVSSPALAEVVRLAWLHELPYEEIADAVGVPVGTVKSRVSRARKLLREELRRQDA